MYKVLFMPRKASEKQLFMIIGVVVASLIIGVIIFFIGGDSFIFVFGAIGFGIIIAIIPLVRRYNQLKKLEDSQGIPNQPQQAYTQNPTYQPYASEQSEYSPSPKPTAKHCTNCGATIGPNESFCQSCGTKK